MIQYLFKRSLSSMFILLGVTLLVYMLIYMSPADPAQVIAAQHTVGPPKPENIDWVRAEYGLDQPVIIQYLRWLWRMIRGDLGYSIRTNNLVLVEVKQCLGFSVVLGSLAMLFVLLVSLPTGILAAIRPNSIWDQAIRVGSLVSVSLPEFWLAFLLILIFAVYLGWLPSFGARSGWHFVLPLVTLGASQAARLSRLIRSVLLAELRQDYLRTARAKGLTRLEVLTRHAFPNIAVPFITVAAYQFSALISGSIIVETVFTWPGLGSYYITAVNFRDIPVIQAMVLVYTVIILTVNLLADLSYGWLDPRIRVE